MHVVSYSELDAFRQCPLKHQLAYVQRWSKPPESGRALARGSLWHLVMETHYRALQAHQRNQKSRKGTWRLTRDTWEGVLWTCRRKVEEGPLAPDPQSGQLTEDQQVCSWMYDGYVEQHGVDPDWQILEVERALEVPLLAESGRRSTAYRLKVRMDLLVRDPHSGLWLVDHKSCSSLPDKLELDIDDQFGLYVAALQEAGWMVRGAIHNAAKTKQLVGDKDGSKPTPLEQRFRRTTMFRTQTELQNLLIDASRTARAAYSGAPVHSSPSPDRCKWRCDFLEPHLAIRRGIPTTDALRDFGFEVDRTRH